MDFKRLFISLMLTYPVSGFAIEVCRMWPEVSVSFSNLDDVFYPKLKSSSSDQVFTIEQFIRPRFPNDRVTYVVRDSVGGLHLAYDSSMKINFAQRGVRILSQNLCRAGDPDAAFALLQSYRNHQRNLTREMALKMSRLPEDKTLCEPVKDETVSVTDRTFFSLRQQSIGSLRVNRFELLGQVLSKADAPKSFQNTQYFEMFSNQWRNARVGMFLIRDHQGRIHAVKSEDITAPGLEKIKSAQFECTDLTSREPKNRPVIREVLPQDLKREAPATTSH